MDYIGIGDGAVYKVDAVIPVATLVDNCGIHLVISMTDYMEAH